MTTRNEFLSNCYIKDLVDEWIYSFQLIPKQISTEKQTNWENVEIPGRSVPLKFYRSSDSETINLDLQLVTSMFQNDNGFEDEIYQAIRNLKSMPYPDYSDKYTRPPHKYLVIIGNTLNDYYDTYEFIGVCKNVKVTYNLPYDFETGKSMYVNVSVTFEEIRDEPLGLNTIRGNY